MGVKLKDIAEQCGTSVATVSYVLSGKGSGEPYLFRRCRS